MRREILIIAMLALCGCAQPDKDTEGYYTANLIDPTVQSYYDGFIKEARNRGLEISYKTIIIQYNPKLEVAGRCTYNPRKQIELNETYLKFGINYYGEWYKEYVIYHELAHCLLMITSHIDSNYNLMMTGPPPLDFDYVAKKKYYLDVLFNETYYQYNNK